MSGKSISLMDSLRLVAIISFLINKFDFLELTVVLYGGWEGFVGLLYFNYWDKKDSSVTGIGITKNR